MKITAKTINEIQVPGNKAEVIVYDVRLRPRDDATCELLLASGLLDTRRHIIAFRE